MVDMSGCAGHFDSGAGPPGEPWIESPYGPHVRGRAPELGDGRGGGLMSPNLGYGFSGAIP